MLEWRLLNFTCSPPLQTLQIRKINDSLTIFSAPFARGGFLPIGGRSTAVKLQDGSVLPSLLFAPH